MVTLGQILGTVVGFPLLCFLINIFYYSNKYNDDAEQYYKKYMNIKMQQDITPLYCDIEELDKKANMEEFMFLGLRLTRGVSRHEFNEKFSIDMFELYDRQIKRNIMLNLMEYNSPYLRLTDKGLDLSNMVMSDFLLD